MAELLTSAQMRAIEQAAIESGEVTGLELMERAGKGVVEAIFEEWPELDGRGASPSGSPEYLDREEEARRAVVLCGPGNNGGDGFVVARLLKERGWEVEVFLYGDAEKLPPDARVNYERWCELGEVDSEDVLFDKHGWDSETNLCFGEQRVVFIDALFGTGLKRALPEEIGGFLGDVTNNSRAYKVAVDIASGLCADSGRMLVDPNEDAMDPPLIENDLTVSFHRAKFGHLLEDGATVSGTLKISDIGLNEAHWEYRWSQLGRRRGGKRTWLPLYWIGERGPQDPSIPFSGGHSVLKGSTSHKYAHGHAQITSGRLGCSGASRLAARGALRVGAGLVTIASPADALPENAAQLTAIMLREVDDARDLRETLQDQRINALCLGPGMGLTEDKAVMVAVALEAKRATVLDADALTLISRHPALFEALHERCVLTPHAGEFARLFPDIAEKLNTVPTKGPAYSKVDATREAAKRAGCVVLFKGPDTVIAAPDGQCSINSAHYDRAAPWLATAGSGDVLAGFITGLLARGFAPMQAAETGAWLHVECALEFGPGLIAEDLPEMLPKVFRKLGL